jgi:hypothetical protein
MIIAKTKTHHDLLTVIMLVMALGPTAGARADLLVEFTPVSLHARNIDLLAALRRVCDQAHCPIWFEGGAGDTVVNCLNDNRRKLSLAFDRVPLKRAILALLRQGGVIDEVEFKFREDWVPRSVVFTRGTKRMDQPITARFVAMPLIEALRSVCDQIDANYALNLGRFERQEVSISFDGAPFDECVRALLAAADASSTLTFESYSHTAIVERRGLLADYSLPGPQDPLSDVITVKCDQDNAYSVAYAIACSSGTAFTLSEDFKLRSCALALDRVRIGQALHAFANSIKTPVNITYDKPVLTMWPKHPLPPIACPPAFNSNPRVKGTR